MLEWEGPYYQFTENVMSVQVKRGEMIRLFVALGVDTATDWDDTRLVQKVESGMAKFREADAPLDADLDALFNEVVAAQGTGDTVEIVADDAEPGATADEPAPAKKRGRAKPAAKKPARKKAASADKKVTWGYRDDPLPVPTEGVMAFVVAQLKKAGLGKEKEGAPAGIHKNRLIELMAKKFPERTPEKMMTNLNNLVPGRLYREYHVYAIRNPATGGYYIVGDGRAKPVGFAAAKRGRKVAKRGRKVAAAG